MLCCYVIIFFLLARRPGSCLGMEFLKVIVMDNVMFYLQPLSTNLPLKPCELQGGRLFISLTLIIHRLQFVYMRQILHA